MKWIGDKSKRSFEHLLGLFVPELSEEVKIVVLYFVSMQVFKVTWGKFGRRKSDTLHKRPAGRGANILVRLWILVAHDFPSTNTLCISSTLVLIRSACF